MKHATLATVLLGSAAAAATLVAVAASWPWLAIAGVVLGLAGVLVGVLTSSKRMTAGRVVGVALCFVPFVVLGLQLVDW